MFLLHCVRSCHAHATLGSVLAAPVLLLCIASSLAGTAAISLQSLLVELPGGAAWRSRVACRALLPAAACTHMSCRPLPFRLSGVCDASVSVHVWFCAWHSGSTLFSCFRVCDRVAAGLGVRVRVVRCELLGFYVGVLCKRPVSTVVG
jgi:hypothetical protein